MIQVLLFLAYITEDIINKWTVWLRKSHWKSYLWIQTDIWYLIATPSIRCAEISVCNEMHAQRTIVICDFGAYFSFNIWAYIVALPSCTVDPNGIYDLLWCNHSCLSCHSYEIRHLLSSHYAKTWPTCRRWGATIQGWVRSEQVKQTHSP